MLDMLSGRLIFSAAETTGTPLWLLFLVVVAVFVVPFALGEAISRFLKLKDLGFKMGLVLLTAVLGLTPFVWQVLQGKLEQSRYEVVHAEWQKKQALLSEESKEANAEVAKLQKALPDCKIVR